MIENLHNKNELICNFHLLDKTLLSLGTNIKNKSQDINIPKEGDEMSIIIPRGAYLKLKNRNHTILQADNQE